MALTAKETKKLARRKKIVLDWMRKELGSFEYQLVAPHYDSDDKAKAAVRRLYLMGRVVTTPALPNRKHPLLNTIIWNHVRNDMRYSFGHFYMNHATTWHAMNDTQWLTYRPIDGSSKPYGYTNITNDDLPAGLTRTSIEGINEALGVGGNEIPLMEVKDERYDAVRVVARNFDTWANGTTLSKTLLTTQKTYWQKLIGFAWWSLETDDYAFRTRGRNPGDSDATTTFTGEGSKDFLVDYLEKWDTYGFESLATDIRFIYSTLSQALGSRKFLFLNDVLGFPTETLPPSLPLWNLLDSKYYVEALGNLNDPFSAPL